jgi:hypothetical protein
MEPRASFRARIAHIDGQGTGMSDTERRKERKDVRPARARTEYRVVQPYEKVDRPVALERQHAFDRPSAELGPYGD